MRCVFILFMVLCCGVYSQEVILTETFGNGIPEGWEVKSNQKRRNWYAKSYQGTHYLSMSAFAGRGKPGYQVKAVLHTPLLDLQGKTCKLRFSFADAYSNGQPLEVYITGEQFNLIKKLDNDYWSHLVNNTGKYDNEYQSTEWIPLPQLSQPYHISLLYKSKQEDKIVTTIIQLNELDVWCQE